MIPGFLRGLLGEPAAAPLSLPAGVEVRRGRWIPAVGGRLSGGRQAALAVTLGDTIVVHPDAPLTDRLVRHELEHVRQWRERPWTFVLRYALAHLRFGYHDNPYEIEARRAETPASTAEWNGSGPGDVPAWPHHLEEQPMSQPIITIERHILDQERLNPGATGAFSQILYDLAFAAKMIAREVNMAGLVDILGGTDERNIHGEEVQKLDAWAHDVIFKALDHCGHLACMASEEADDFIPIPEKFPTGKYVLLFDPLDGSSNIEANVSIGTIFSIHKKITPGDRGQLEDCLQRGRDQVAAGYVVYGSSTMLVYTTGHGVHGFTLDPSIGEFLLSHRDIQIPVPGRRIYSVNEGNSVNWSPGQRAFVDHLKGVDGTNAKPFSSRYIGSLVADFHRTLLYGGVFMYPADRKSPKGKLRLLYEAAPLAFIAEQAGGRGSDGRRNILDICPEQLHQRTPLYLGSAEWVDMAEAYLARQAEVPVNA